MPSITRDRGCCYYVPYIATLCVCFAVASLGVWAAFTKKCRDYTIDALDELDITVKNLDRINPALIATAITYLVLAVLLYITSLWRSFIEAGHDATGVVNQGSTAWMVISVFLDFGWFWIFIWVILMAMADVVWAALVYLSKEAIKAALLAIAKYGAATWLPSSGQPCPGQCINLTFFAFVSSELQDACICDEDKLRSAQHTFDKTYTQMTGVLVGIWVMLLASLCLLINTMCQISHTRRERELLQRVSLSRAF